MERYCALHHEEIEIDPQRTTKLWEFEDRYNWKDLEFHLAINKISKFEKNNPGIAVNVLYVAKKNIHTLQQSDCNITRSKQISLLLITDDTKTHYTTITNFSRLLGCKNSKNFCLNCLLVFNTVESTNKHYEYCIDDEAVAVAMPKESEKWL